MNFNSHLDLVVAVAVRLVNALTAGEERGRACSLPDGEGLARAVAGALAAAGGTRQVTDQDAAEMRAIAEELRVVFEAVAGDDVDAAARQVNKLLAWTGARPLLRRHGDESWHLHFHGTSDTLASGWAAGCATGLAVVIGSDDRGRLGVCTAPRCDRVYVDTSRNGTRRFCSTSCQNRVKTAAFRARHGQHSPAPQPQRT
ncbi:MAG: CGNR zinc finger domain-containing protein [Micromonosporaceae bacterium]